MEVLSFENVDYNKGNVWVYDYDSSYEEDYGTTAVNALSQRLEQELRAAKRSHFSCGEVLLPCGLLQTISQDILSLADKEPCGLRGCTLYLNFEGEEDCRRLSTVRCDPTTASTFELYLTLKQSSTKWNSFLPQFLKKITRGGTVVISSEYELQKKKLYRSYMDTD
ncbi:protein charybde [Agrilus planipennis]|uniref:Protein charybde n=1 Tax=Agrilus planipennis TaxID=224129 RepID=A0A1W4WLE2_AGRPL|nr:protein charybde [Agrilus planipennis]